MTSYIKSFLGYDDQTKEAWTTRRGLPSSWYTSKQMYELERRAIFSRKWMMITHKLRFDNPGDYVSFKVTDFSFFLCMDRSGNVNGFHNICRHRGYPLINRECGNAKIIACSYHGWSYGINGQLAKAPHFESLSKFDREKNGLLPVHVHVDKLGFVWVNLEATKEPTVPWTDDFLGADTQERFAHFDFSKYTFDHTWAQEGKYNWKVLADNYNECLHCKVSHPDIAATVDVATYRTDGHNKHIQHHTNVTTTAEGKVLHIASTYYFPNSCMTVSPHFFYMMRCVPTSANTTSMEYEIYRHRDASDAEFASIDGLFKRILAEDRHLCDNIQKTLNAGVYVTGEVHPSYESGPLYFQGLVKQAVTEHRAEENRTKREIWPARQRVPAGADIDVQSEKKMAEELEFCAALDPEKSRGLEW